MYFIFWPTEFHSSSPTVQTPRTGWGPTPSPPPTDNEGLKSFLTTASQNRALGRFFGYADQEDWVLQSTLTSRLRFQPIVPSIEDVHDLYSQSAVQSASYLSSCPTAQFWSAYSSDNARLSQPRSPPHRRTMSIPPWRIQISSCLTFHSLRW